MARAAIPRKGRRVAGRQAWLIAFGTLLLMLPVAINGYPLLFYDTPGYLNTGTGVLKRIGLLEMPDHVAAREQAPMAAGPEEKKTLAYSDARSLYYGLLASVSKRLGGLHLIALLQALWVATAMVLAMRYTGPRTTRGKAGVLVAAAVVGGAAFSTSVILPDMAGGVLLLSFGLAAAYADRLRRFEWAFWLLSIIAAICFHKAFLMVAVALFLISGFVSGRPLWRGKAGLLIGGSVAVSALLTFGADLAVERVTGVKTPHTPFVLARVVEDGTALSLLRKECPRRQWETCSMMPGMPMMAGEFLWTGTMRDGVHVPGWMEKPVPQRARISAESNEIVRRTIANDPWGQLRATLSNAVDQFLYVGVTRYDQSDTLARFLALTMASEAPRMRAGLFYERPEFLKGATAAIMISTLGSALALLIFSILRLTSGHQGKLTTFAMIVLIGAGLNAALCGALAVVVDRYQGRLAWTLLFSALALGSAWLTSRRAVPHLRPAMLSPEHSAPSRSASNVTPVR